MTQPQHKPRPPCLSSTADPRYWSQKIILLTKRNSFLPTKSNPLFSLLDHLNLLNKGNEKKGFLIANALSSKQVMQITTVLF